MGHVRFCNLATAVVCVGMVMGCGSGTSHHAHVDQAKDSHGNNHAHVGHAHNHAAIGPHGGHVIELGSEAYHAELVHDYDAGLVTVYLLGAEAQHCRAACVEDALINLVSHGEPAQFRLNASPHGDETADRCSRFVATDAELIHWLQHEVALRGRLNLTIAGQCLVGDIEHAPHGVESPHDNDHHNDPHHSVGRPVTQR